MLEVLLLFVDFSQADGGGQVMVNQAVHVFAKEGIQKSRMPDGIAFEKSDATACIVAGRNITSDQSSPMVSAESTEPALVRTIMALLATFESAGILPAEGTSDANQLIHGLIQFQSSMVKSRSSALHEYLSSAVAHEAKPGNGDLWKTMYQEGLNSKMLEALVLYDRKRPLWNQPAVVPILQAYNISRGDWELISQKYAQADAVYRAQGSSIHEIYEQWRVKLRGVRHKDFSGAIKEDGVPGFG